MTTAERLEQLRELPRVTAADRERYKQWEQEARVFLQFNEPRETYFRRDVDTSLRLCGSVPMTDHSTLDLDEWRSYWRSLPDYDGPPMRAPSGPVFEFFDCTGTPAQDFSTITNTSPVWLREQITYARAQAYAELLRHFAAMARRGECEFVRFGPIDMTPKDAYDHPSLGGRGWCPKLARVET